MASAVTRQEDESLAVELADQQFVRRFTECRIDLDPLDVLESFELVQAGPADNAKCPLFPRLLAQLMIAFVANQRVPVTFS